MSIRDSELKQFIELFYAGRLVSDQYDDPQELLRDTLVDRATLVSEEKVVEKSSMAGRQSPSSSDSSSTDDPFYSTIMRLFAYVDGTKGITSKFHPIPRDGDHPPEFCVIRDARGASEPDETMRRKAEDSKYLIMGINYTLALKALLISHNMNFDIQDLIDNANTFLNDTQIIDSEPVRAFQDDRYDYAQYFFDYVRYALAPHLIKHDLAGDLADAIKMLDTCKDWAALEYQSFHVMTVNQVEEIDIVRVDSPMACLTDSIKEEYLNIRALPPKPRREGPRETSVRYIIDYTDDSSDDDDSNQEDDNHSNLLSSLGHRLPFLGSRSAVILQTWFDRLKDYEQVLYRNYYQPLLLQTEEGRILPSQLRNRLPGLKNGYHLREWAIDTNGSAIKIGEVLHNGSLPYLLDSDSDTAQNEMTRTAALAVEQQQQYLQSIQAANHPTQHMMITLNSAIADTVIAFKQGSRQGLFDAKIIAHSAEAMKARGGLSANVCLNGFRRCEPRAIEQITEQLLKFEEFSTAFAFNASSSQINAQSLLIQQLNEKIRSTRELLTKTRFNEKDGEVKGISRISHFLQAAISYNRLIDAFIEHSASTAALKKLGDYPYLYVSVGCASGENRTGLALIHAQIEMLLQHLKLPSNHQESDESAAEATTIRRNEVRTRLAADGHTDITTAYQGGNAGTNGIRNKSMNSLPNYYPYSARAHLQSTASNVKSAYALGKKQIWGIYKAESEKLQPSKSSNPASLNPKNIAKIQNMTYNKAVSECATTTERAPRTTYHRIRNSPFVRNTFFRGVKNYRKVELPSVTMPNYFLQTYFKTSRDDITSVEVAQQREHERRSTHTSLTR